MKSLVWDSRPGISAASRTSSGLSVTGVGVEFAWGTYRGVLLSLQETRGSSSHMY